MITAKDIREKGFETVGSSRRHTGYAFASVDDFMEKLAADVERYTDELSTLRSKNEAMSKELEGYRLNESAISAVLMQAQKLSAETEREAKERADEVEREAQERADAIIAEAEAEARRIIGDADVRAQEEEARFCELKKSYAEFAEKTRGLCADYLAGLDGFEAECGPGETEDFGDEVRIPEGAEPVLSDVETAFADTVPDFEELAAAVEELSAEVVDEDPDSNTPFSFAADFAEAYRLN